MKTEYQRFRVYGRNGCMGEFYSYGFDIESSRNIFALMKKEKVKILYQMPITKICNDGGSVVYENEEAQADCQPHKSGDLHGQATKLPLEVIMEEVDLVGCFDAQVWAKEFCNCNTSSDEGTMLGWFANAIMAGYDYAKQEAKLEANGNAQQQVQADSQANSLT